MNTTLQIFYIASPLLLITLGGLVSEYAGRMACFLDGIINLGAFLCFAFTVATKNIFFGATISVLCCMILVFALEKFSSHFKANMFLSSLGMNLFFTALCSLLSSIFFGTRSVLSSEVFSYSSNISKIETSALCILFSLLIILLLKFTKTGLALRITGSDSDVLESRGISSDKYRTLSWLIAAFCGTAGGCVFATRLSSYVPNISSGRGWTALAAVFLGRKNPVIIILAVAVFAAAEYASSYLQNIPLFANVQSSVLLALPYIASLVLILIMPNEKK